MFELTQTAGWRNMGRDLGQVSITVHVARSDEKCVFQQLR